MHELDNPVTWDEFESAVKRLKNEKSPGLNGVPPDAFKAMANMILEMVLNFINKFWNDEADFKEWHASQVVPIEKRET